MPLKNANYTNSFQLRRSHLNTRMEWRNYIFWIPHSFFFCLWTPTKGCWKPQCECPSSFTNKIQFRTRKQIWKMTTLLPNVIIQKLFFIFVVEWIFVPCWIVSWETVKSWVKSVFCSKSSNPNFPFVNWVSESSRGMMDTIIQRIHNQEIFQGSNQFEFKWFPCCPSWWKGNKNLLDQERKAQTNDFNWNKKYSSFCSDIYEIS